MGKKDISVKLWLKDNRRFADLFNGVCFDGRQVIRPEELEELDGESNFVLEDKDGKRRYVQRYRDIIKGWNGFVLRGILAVELQDKVHYAMPVKNMIMDAMSYTDQMGNIWENVPDEEKKMLVGSPDYFSRFRKDDKLCPVITLVFYCGDNWDGNIDLHSMFNLTGMEEQKDVMKFVEKYIPNYHINLYNPLKEKEFSKFITDLQIVFDMLQYKNNKKELKQYINNNRHYFGSLDYESCNAVTALLETDKLFPDDTKLKKEGNNVCKAIDDLYNDGVEVGMEKGIEKGNLQTIINLITKGKLTIEDGAEELGISIEDLKMRLA